MKLTPISQEWIELKAITKVVPQEWEIPISERDNDFIIIRGSSRYFEAFHEIDGKLASKKLYYTEEIEQLYMTLTGKNL
jgi:hypothetical protein